MLPSVKRVVAMQRMPTPNQRNGGNGYGLHVRYLDSYLDEFRFRFSRRFGGS